MNAIHFVFFLSHSIVCSFYQGVVKTEPSFALEAEFTHKNTLIIVYKNKLFDGNDLESLFKIRCDDKRFKNPRTFYVKKTNSHLRSKTLSEFAFTEKLLTNELVYPFGWETSKISHKELKENCILILENKIKPL